MDTCYSRGIDNDACCGGPQLEGKHSVDETVLPLRGRIRFAYIRLKISTLELKELGRMISQLENLLDFLRAKTAYLVVPPL